MFNTFPLLFSKSRERIQISLPHPIVHPTLYLLCRALRQVDKGKHIKTEAIDAFDSPEIIHFFRFVYATALILKYLRNVNQYLFRLHLFIVDLFSILNGSSNDTSQRHTSCRDWFRRESRLFIASQKTVYRYGFVSMALCSY